MRSADREPRLEEDVALDLEMLVLGRLDLGGHSPRVEFWLHPCHVTPSGGEPRCCVGAGSSPPSAIMLYGQTESQTAREASDAAGIPANFLRALATGQHVLDEIASGVSPEDAIEERRSALGELLARFDAVHILGSVILGESLMDPDTYRESDDPGAGYIRSSLPRWCADRAVRARPLQPRRSTRVRWGRYVG